MTDMYNQKVIDIFSNPQNVGEIPDADGVGVAGGIACGDILKVYLKIENNIIADAKFKTFGCAAAISASSLATTMVIGKTLEEAEALTNKQVIKELGGLPPQKTHCSVLAEEAIKDAIKNYRSKHGK